MTQYETYFDNATFELSRILRFLELGVAAEQIERSTSAISQKLRRQKIPPEMLDDFSDPEIARLYAALCHEAHYFDRRAIQVDGD